MTLDWWTLGFQTVNIVILVWLLQRFFWKPVAAVIAERRAAAQKALAEAQAAQTKAKLDLADIEKTRAGFAAERETILRDAREAASRETAAKLEAAGRQGEALIAAAKAGVEKDEAAATRAWGARSSDLAVEIAKRLAARLDGPAVEGAFLDWALKAIRALPSATRLEVGALTATSASPLDAPGQSRTTQLISEAFGAPVQITFKTEADLIAGLELKSDHLVIASSWRADLAKILADLAHAK